jgi:hypothetical protein
MMKKGKSTGAPAKTKAAGRAKPASVRAKTSKRDPRKVAPPTAPASVAAKAVEAIAPVAAVATAEPKQAAAATPAAGSKAPVDGSHSPADRAMTLGAAAVPFAGAFSLGADQARAAYLRAGAGNENLRQAVADSTTTTTRGLVELTGKVLDLWRAQSDAALDLWRSTLTSGSLSEAIRAQTSGFRRSYEATTSQWREIAETAGRLMGDAAKTFQSTLTQAR